ncbi:alpha/beta hydrolase [Leucobacter weissii]|uniref:Alpha/beta hydrolase n=1 Tax=Leucobacter weissii TaxID=1983706 RepID=A0A939MIR7_9MICO|nr:alpha/beta hydrolase [Leucobacter weissii]MBO1901351.1 alpha/beta hydrolase [Leucobacter weissii]
MSGRERRYESGEVTMAFTEHGERGERAFVLVHGIGMGRIVFSGVSEVLGSAGRVLAVDLPGFGDSPEPGTAATLEETAAVVARFIDEQTSERVVLVGHSMGTQIVAEIARNHPDRVETLVLIAPTVNRYERTAAKQALRMVQDLAGEGPKVLLTGLAEYVKTSPLWFVNKLRFMLNHRLEDLCPDIAVPTLVLRGEHDRVCPRGWVEEVAEALPRGVKQEIPGRGHEAVIKSPEPVASMILDHLSGLGPD